MIGVEKLQLIINDHSTLRQQWSIQRHIKHIRHTRHRTKTKKAATKTTKATQKTRRPKRASSQEEFENTIGVIRIRKSTDRQHNDQKKKDKQRTYKACT